MKLEPFLVPSSETLIRATSILRSGGLVAFPTETVYGLGANALNASAVEKIYRIKGRPSNNPLIIHVADLSQVRELVSEWPELAQRCADAFWPGPLTIVVKKSELVQDIVTAGGPSVALRIPAAMAAQSLLRAVGLPLAAPSANRSGELSPTTAHHVFQSLGNDIDLILDGGPCSGGIESSVVDFTSSVPRLLRPGLISIEELEQVIGQIQQATSLSLNHTDSALPSPGMLARHYAPRTPVELFHHEEELTKRACILQSQQKRIYKYILPGSEVEAAKVLYQDLHRCDEQGYDAILILLPPDTPAWQAIRDRLRRAATPL